MTDLAALVHQYRVESWQAGETVTVHHSWRSFGLWRHSRVCWTEHFDPFSKEEEKPNPNRWVNSLPVTGSLSQSYRKTDRCPPFIKPSLRGREGNSFIIFIISSSICELYRILGFIVTFFTHAYSVTGSNGHFLWPSVLPTPLPWPAPLERESHCKVRWRKSHTLFGANRGGRKREPSSYRSIAPWETHFLGQSRLFWAQTPPAIIVASYLLTRERGRWKTC